MAKSPFVTKIDAKLSHEIQHDLEEQGFNISKKPYMLFSAQKKGLAVHSYESGKLVVQGAAMGEFMEFYLEPKLGVFTYTNPHANLDTTARIGSDESGKGDFFGPLCVASVFADSASIEKLAQSGIQDSKTLSDKKIEQMCKTIYSLCTVESLVLSPLKYNELYPKFGNLNTMLAWAHATCIDNLLKKAPTETIIIDKFAHEGVIKRAFTQKKIGVAPILRVRAESDVVVAAASIIARGLFVSNMHRLGCIAGLDIPKGGSAKATGAARQIMDQKGEGALKDFVKMHFKNYRDLL